MVKSILKWITRKKIFAMRPNVYIDWLYVCLPVYIFVLFSFVLFYFISFRSYLFNPVLQCCVVSCCVVLCFFCFFSFSYRHFICFLPITLLYFTFTIVIVIVTFVWFYWIRSAECLSNTVLVYVSYCNQIKFHIIIFDGMDTEFFKFLKHFI